MKLRTLVWRELFTRKSQLATSFLSIVLGVGVIVAVKNITVYSEKAIARELDALGANILILPKSVSLQNYYGADMQGEEFPEGYLSKLLNSDIQGLDNLSPKLSTPFEADGKRFILTGILPKSEFQAKAAWQDAGIFSRPQGCGTVATLPNQKGASHTRIIETIDDSEALVGADLGAHLKLKPGDAIPLLGKSFTVRAILPQTGTVDDSRAFAHLHTVQRLTGKKAVLNAIEVVGCCNQISKGLVQKINHLLPEAKVVTISQIVDTQIKTNRMMSQLSLVFLVLILLAGGAGIANYMFANVYERRREIGTLMAMGATPGLVLRLFLLKALLLGLVGGITGFGVGTILAMILGPRLAGIPVLPMPILALLAIGIAVAVALVASYFPARKAARLDPSRALQEV